MGWCRGGKVDGWARGRADGKAGARGKADGRARGRADSWADGWADGKAGAGDGSHLLNTKASQVATSPGTQPQHKGGDRQDADKHADDDITCPHIGTGKTFNQVCVKILSATARINNKL